MSNPPILLRPLKMFIDKIEFSSGTLPHDVSVSQNVSPEALEIKSVTSNPNDALSSAEGELQAATGLGLQVSVIGREGQTRESVSIHIHSHGIFSALTNVRDESLDDQIIIEIRDTAYALLYDFMNSYVNRLMQDSGHGDFWLPSIPFESVIGPPS